MTVIVAVCAIILAVAIVIGLIRVITAKDLGSRAVVSDLVYFCAVGMLTIIGIHVSSSIVLDVIFLASMVGILATIALSRILTRGASLMNELTATILVGVFGITGSLIVLASALAMFRVRDALSRINVFSPATGLGLPLIALAAYVSDLYVEGFSVTSLLVLLATILCLIIVSSVASNTLSRASVLSGQPIYRKTSPNRLAQPPEGIEDPDPADAEPVTKDDRPGPNG